MVYYLGTDGDAPLVPWSEAKPAFHVSEIHGPEREEVMRQLCHRRVVYLGSHQGCGCGFRSHRDGYLMGGDSEEKETLADHLALAAYLKGLPPSERPIQIFGCWSGDEAEPIERTRACSVSDLLDPSFGFQEREVVTMAR